MTVSNRLFQVLLLVVLAQMHTFALAQNNYLVSQGFTLSKNCSSNCTSSLCCVRSGNHTITNYCADSLSTICCGCQYDDQESSCSACANLQFCGPVYECFNVFGLAVPGAIVVLVFVSYLSITIYEKQCTHVSVI